jgi:hypothetical protein
MKRKKGEVIEMLRAVPDGWFSYNFTVFDRAGTPVARADLSNWRETAKIVIGGTRYEAHSKGWTGKEFVLEKEDGRVVAVAQKPSVWSNRFVFEHAGNRYELKKESVWGSAFVLWRDGAGSVGSVRSKGFFKREWIANLPEELPLEVRMFVVWLMVILWKRGASAAAGGGGGAAGAGG